MMTGILRALLRLMYRVRFDDGRTRRRIADAVLYVAPHRALLDSIVLATFLPGRPVVVSATRGTWARLGRRAAARGAACNHGRQRSGDRQEGDALAGRRPLGGDVSRGPCGVCARGDEELRRARADRHQDRCERSPGNGPLCSWRPPGDHVPWHHAMHGAAGSHRGESAQGTAHRLACGVAGPRSNCNVF